MTAAGRGQRVDKDQYYTPAWCVERLCEAVRLPWRGAWCEPGAGSGHIIRAANDWASLYDYPSPWWTAFEIDARRRKVLRSLCEYVCIGDFLAEWSEVDMGLAPPHNLGLRFRFGLGNPSYAITTPVVEKLRRICREFCLLLPLSYLGSAGRAEQFQADQPDVYILPDRPCFVRVKHIKPDGSIRTTTSDSSVYGWFYWPEKPQRRGGIETLRRTDPEVLAEAKARAPMIVIDEREAA